MWAYHNFICLQHILASHDGHLCARSDWTSAQQSSCGIDETALIREGNYLFIIHRQWVAIYNNEPTKGTLSLLSKVDNFNGKNERSFVKF